MSQTTVLKVLLHCDGCVSKVKRHTRRLEGVESFHVDHKNSKVTVYGTASPQAVLDKVLRAGKTAEFWPLPLEPANEVIDVATTAEEDVVEEKTKTKKTKASDVGGNASKKQKNGNKSKPERQEEIEQLEDFGEIVDEADMIAGREADDESDERVLITSKRPTKKGIFRKV